MNGPEHAAYRMRLAEGFLAEANQDTAIKRWRSATDNSQLAVENAAKAVLALCGVFGRTHQPAPHLRQAILNGNSGAIDSVQIERMAQLTELLGFDIHVQTDYGDETGKRTPWGIFGQPDAEEAVAIAEEAVQLGQLIVQMVTSKQDASADSES